MSKEWNPSALQQMIKKELDPTERDKSARYENARYATSMGYQLLSKMVGPQTSVETFITQSRQIADAIESDLNKHQDILNANTPEAVSAALP